MQRKAKFASAAATEARAALYAEMSPHHLTPLWEVLHALVPPQPNTPCVPAFWRYDDIRPYLMRRGRSDHRRRSGAPRADSRKPGAAWAERHHAIALRRVATDLAGRSGPSHRHAKRAALCGRNQGAFTAVNGERTTMQPGDFIITPQWTWHDHGSGPMARWSGWTGSTFR